MFDGIGALDVGVVGWLSRGLFGGIGALDDDVVGWLSPFLVMLVAVIVVDGRSSLVVVDGVKPAAVRSSARLVVVDVVVEPAVVRSSARPVVVDVVEPAAVCSSARLVNLFLLRSATMALHFAIRR